MFKTTKTTAGIAGVLTLAGCLLAPTAAFASTADSIGTALGSVSFPGGSTAITAPATAKVVSSTSATQTRSTPASSDGASTSSGAQSAPAATSTAHETETAPAASVSAPVAPQTTESSSSVQAVAPVAPVASETPAVASDAKPVTPPQSETAAPAASSPVMAPLPSTNAASTPAEDAPTPVVVSGDLCASPQTNSIGSSMIVSVNEDGTQTLIIDGVVAVDHGDAAAIQNAIELDNLRFSCK